MRKPDVSLVFVMLFLTGCANPLNKVTSDNYAQTCAEAERNGRLDVAEEACSRAAINVDWGNLGPRLRSERLYNLGRIKRQVGKFIEAEEIFKESLSIEETLDDSTDQKIARRLIELSVCLAAQDKWEEGSKYLRRASTISDQFSGSERAYAIEVLSQFAKNMRVTNQTDAAKFFEEKAAKLR